MDLASIQSFASAASAAANAIAGGSVTIGGVTYTEAQGAYVVQDGIQIITQPDTGAIIRAQVITAGIPKSILASRPDLSVPLVINGVTYSILEIFGDNAASVDWLIRAQRPSKS